MSDEELKQGIRKFIHFGNIIAVIENDKIIAFLMLYCNNLDTLEAYICNVYVLSEYRGSGLSKLVLDKAINMCIAKNFQNL